MSSTQSVTYNQEQKGSTPLEVEFFRFLNRIIRECKLQAAFSEPCTFILERKRYKDRMVWMIKDYSDAVEKIKKAVKDGLIEEEQKRPSEAPTTALDAEIELMMDRLFNDDFDLGDWTNTNIFKVHLEGWYN